MDLTIIIPTRNRNDGVIECVLALDHNGADLVVVDDGSDELVALPSETVRVIRHKRKRGRAAAINSGLAAALYNTVLIIDDDIYAAPDMVLRLFEEFTGQNNPKLGLAAHVVWDPDIPLTITMKWMEDMRKFPLPMVVWKPFVLSHGGYDENFSGRREDLELQLRLKPHGFAVRIMESAVGFQHRSFKIRDLIEREFTDGISSVFLHARHPDFMPQIENTEALMRNENQAADAQAVVEEISFLEQSGSSVLPAGAAQLYAHVCRYYLLHGVSEGLNDIGNIPYRQPNSTIVAIYNEAAHLHGIGELDEARRLFRFVRQRADDQYWDIADYHLGCIENELGNPTAARHHLLDCLVRNPGHDKARRLLNSTTMYQEVEPNVFEIVQPQAPRKPLFIVFGGLSNIVNAFPVVAALRTKFQCKVSWLTAPEYVSLARLSSADAVYQGPADGIIPWDWVHSEGYTHVFLAEPEAQSASQEAAPHAIDFMANKCGVRIEKRRTRLQLATDALCEAEKFMRQNKLSRSAFITAYQGDGKKTHWPNSNLAKLGQQLEMPVVVFGAEGSTDIPGTISCTSKAFPLIAALIHCSCFYLGHESGVSWLATASDTPMALFADHQTSRTGIRNLLRGEKDDIQQWDIYTRLETVVEHIQSMIRLGVPVLK